MKGRGRKRSDGSRKRDEPILHDGSSLIWLLIFHDFFSTSSVHHSRWDFLLFPSLVCLAVFSVQCCGQDDVLPHTKINPLIPLRVTTRLKAPRRGIHTRWVEWAGCTCPTRLWVFLLLLASLYVFSEISSLHLAVHLSRLPCFGLVSLVWTPTHAQTRMQKREENSKTESQKKKRARV